MAFDCWLACPLRKGQLDAEQRPASGKLAFCCLLAFFLNLRPLSITRPLLSFLIIICVVPEPRWPSGLLSACGVVAQLVERALSMREVRGSKPCNSIDYYS